MKIKILLFIVCFLNVGLLFSQVNLSNGLIAYYPFNSNVNDVSGNNFNAVNFGATLTTDASNRVNNAYLFNGTSSHILLPSSNRFNFAATDSFTLSCWIQPDNNALWSLQALIVKSVFDNNVQNANWNYGLYVSLNKAMSGYANNNFLNGTTTFSQSKCWYHLVVTYKNGTWYLYVNGKVEAEDLSRTRFISQNGSVTSVIALGKKGSANGEYFKGKLDEVRIYNRNLNKFEVEALYKLENSIADFSFTQNACNPKQINLRTETQNLSKTYWNFGDGMVDSNKTQINYTYSNFSNYNVQLVTQNNFGCYDTVIKNIAVFSIFDNTIISNKNDTSICLGRLVPLSYNNTVTDFCWSSSDNSINGSISNPMVAPINSTTYTLTTKSLGNNLVVNGNFEQGNIGFQTDYTFNPGTAGAMQGIYTIANNPRVWLSAFSACADHTPGITNDKMMMIDGSTRPNVELWRQTVSIQPNTMYNISFWLQSIVAQNPAVIKVKINGKNYSKSLIADFAACSWKNFSAEWYSGNLSSVTIALEDSVLLSQGNDFAIDDIAFSEVILKQDSVRVVVNKPSLQTINKTICFGQTFNGYSNTGSYTNTYNDIYGCDSIINLNLIVLNAPVVEKESVSGCGSVVVNGTNYSISQLINLSIKNQLGCDSIIKEINIVVLPNPVNFIIPSNITVCLGQQFILNGYNKYIWNTGDTTSSIRLNGLNKYWVEITDNNGCIGSDTFNVIYNSATYDSSSRVICFGDSINGYKTTGIYKNTFTSTTGCDSINVLNLTVLPAPKNMLDTIKGCGSIIVNGSIYNNNQLLTSIIRNQLGCDSIVNNTQIIITKPSSNLKLLINDTAICEGDKVVLNPGKHKKYLWSSGSEDSVISVNKVGEYWVKVTDTINCDVIDTFKLTDVFQKPNNFIAINQITTCLGQTFSVAGFSRYQWNTGETSSSIKLNGLNKYWVNVTNGFGCTSKDSFTVVYSNNLVNSSTTAFSPNGDGINDELRLFEDNSCFKSYRLVIFSRTGQKLYETIDVNRGWKGTFNNKPLPIDVYYYILNFETTTGLKNTQSGYITLLR
jgi:gliding motility-associated-like protein